MAYIKGSYIRKADRERIAAEKLTLKQAKKKEPKTEDKPKKSYYVKGSYIRKADRLRMAEKKAKVIRTVLPTRMSKPTTSQLPPAIIAMPDKDGKITFGAVKANKETIAAIVSDLEESYNKASQTQENFKTSLYYATIKARIDAGNEILGNV